MARQQRSLLTRSALLEAAARDVDRHGYGGTSMHRVVRAADVTMGALTFHFATKDRLLEELAELGRSRIQEKVREAADLPTAPLRRARTLLWVLMDLLHRDVVVRAAVRLAEELPGARDWAESWFPLAREMVRDAEEKGQLRDGVTPEAVTEAARHILAGAEVRARTRGPRDEDAEAAETADTTATADTTETADTAEARFTRLCDLILYGVSAVPPARPPEPG